MLSSSASNDLILMLTFVILSAQADLDLPRIAVIGNQRDSEIQRNRRDQRSKALLCLLISRIVLTTRRSTSQEVLELAHGAPLNAV